MKEMFMKCVNQEVSLGIFYEHPRYACRENSKLSVNYFCLLCTFIKSHVEYYIIEIWKILIKLLKSRLKKLWPQLIGEIMEH